VIADQTWNEVVARSGAWSQRISLTREPVDRRFRGQSRFTPPHQEPTGRTQCPKGIRDLIGWLSERREIKHPEIVVSERQTKFGSTKRGLPREVEVL
jgi:hypothetical protein